MPRGRPKGSGNKTKAVPVQYDFCGETVEDLANELISNYHPHLANCGIAYLFKNKGITLKGMPAVATAEKCSPKVHALCDKHFVVTICYEDWNNCTDQQKKAILDHELSHCWITEAEDTGDTMYKILPHDFEDFGEIIRRYGAYSHSIEKLKHVMDSIDHADSTSLDVSSDESDEDLLD